MPKRVKEEEKSEKIIRALLKLPENRKCMNCNVLGPQYVCTTFLTFVCTNCSGIHREFTHRVKSVSMAKFNAEEVSALQAGGNERARQIYLKDWDPQRNSYPDGSNLHRLRDFIKHVYVDRKYTGERSNQLPRLRLGDNDEIGESRKVAAYLGGFRSPRYESRSEQSSIGKSSSGRSDDRVRYYYDERRSPRYNQQNLRVGGYRKSPVRFEVVDDRFRDDEFGSGRRSNSSRHSTGREWKPGSRSPDCQKSMDRSSSLVVRPVKDILGENSPPLEVRKRSEEVNEKNDDGSANNQQKSSPSGSSTPVNGDSAEDKNDRALCLLDIKTKTEPSDGAAATPETMQIIPADNVGNQSSHEASANAKTSPPPQPNTVEFLLFELSAPYTAPNMSGPQSGDVAPSTIPESNTPTAAAAAMQMSTSPGSIDASPSASTTNMPGQPSGTNMPAAGTPSEQMLTKPGHLDASESASTTTTPVQWSFGIAGAPPIASTTEKPVQPYAGNSPVAAVSQIASQNMTSTTDKSVLPSGCNMPGSDVSPTSPLRQMSTSPNNLSVSSTMSTTVPNTAQPTTSGVEAQPSLVEAGGRKALPEELFCERFLPTPAPLTRWQSGPPHALGFSMQYYPNAMVSHAAKMLPNAMIVPPQANKSKSTNPFDLNSEAAPMQAQSFPSMPPLQGVLPNVGLVHTSDVANPSGLMAPQAPSYASGIYPQSTLPSAATSNPIMGPQPHMNMTHSRLQEGGGFVSDKAAFGTVNPPQQQTGGSTANSFPSMGGNPFG